MVAEMISIHILCAVCLVCRVSPNSEGRVLLTDLSGGPVLNGSWNSFALTIPIILADGVKVSEQRIFTSTKGR